MGLKRCLTGPFNAAKKRVFSSSMNLGQTSHLPMCSCEAIVRNLFLFNVVIMKIYILKNLKVPYGILVLSQVP
jgi:hypothetical protein